jgi:hypothetical protein
MDGLFDTMTNSLKNTKAKPINSAKIKAKASNQHAIPIRINNCIKDYIGKIAQHKAEIAASQLFCL